MIERLLRRTAGEVRVRVTGASLPRFLNACTQGGVRLRRMERVSWDRMDATLSLGDFRKLRSCMGRTGCRVHILKRHGVPFVLARLLPRTALLAGLAAFCVMAYLVGTRVWEIRTDISPSLGEDAVMSKLASLGVDIGTPLRSIDTPSIRRQMMVWDPDITFFALNLRGNSLTVTAHAGAAAPEVADEAHPMRIVASHGGVVRQVRALRGARAGRGCGGDGRGADRQSRAADEGERSPAHGSGGGDGRGVYRAPGAVGAAVEKGKKILLQENVSTYVD